MLSPLKAEATPISYVVGLSPQEHERVRAACSLQFPGQTLLWNLSYADLVQLHMHLSASHPVRPHRWKWSVL